MAVITLTTDFGIKDHFVAAIKGKIISEVPDVNIVDISHQISPFSVQECAYVLKNAYPEFPKGSIHLIGLDSGVSPENAHLVALMDDHYFIGADNGVLSIIAATHKPEKVFSINLPNTRPGPFPERDVFAKVACHLARGGKMELVGQAFDGLKEVKVVEPSITNDGKTILGHVIYIDHYGNVVTNITKGLFEAYRNGRNFEILARTHRLTSIFNNYNKMIDFELPKNKRKGPSDFLAIFNAAGHIELAIYKSDLKTVGGASSLIGLNHQDLITINFL